MRRFCRPDGNEKNKPTARFVFLLCTFRRLENSVLWFDFTTFRPRLAPVEGNGDSFPEAGSTQGFTQVEALSEVHILFGVALLYFEV